MGEEYKPHHDFFHINTDYYENIIKSGGQRTHSFLFYLNDNFEGGETEFTTKKIKISAKRGRMLIWENLDYNGDPDMDSLHAGLPVVGGEKWVAIVWVRENKFQ
jgi:prolyl 4-hydroxylase